MNGSIKKFNILSIVNPCLKYYTKSVKFVEFIVDSTAG
jgi:hypothetical protein